MFELARICQFIVIDCFVLGFRFVSHALGPWITIFCIQVRLMKRSVVLCGVEREELTLFF